MAYAKVVVLFNVKKKSCLDTFELFYFNYFIEVEVKMCIKMTNFFLFVFY